MSTAAQLSSSLKQKVHSHFSQSGNWKGGAGPVDDSSANDTQVQPIPQQPQQTDVQQQVPEPVQPNVQVQNQPPVQPVTEPTQVSTRSQPDFTTDEKLALLDQALTEVEQKKALDNHQPLEEPTPAAETNPPVPPIQNQSPQPVTEPTQDQPAVPAQPQVDTGVMAQAVSQQAIAPDPYQAPVATQPISKKESLNISTSESLSADLGSGIQMVEQEPNPEIPPEVESFLEQKQDNIDKLAQEIVVADQQPISKQTKFPTKPVVVIPITEQEKKAGLKKSPKFSFRWLVEWSLKIVKKFSGEVIYRQT